MEPGRSSMVDSISVIAVYVEPTWRNPVLENSMHLVRLMIGTHPTGICNRGHEKWIIDSMEAITYHMSGSTAHEMS